MADTSAPYGISNYGTTLVIVSWVEFALGLTVISARIYTSLFITRRIGLDLYFAILTFV